MADLEAISKDEDVVLEWDSNFYDQLSPKKYWVDRERMIFGHMFFARSLSITWSENPRFWRWIPVPYPGGLEIELADLLMVSWLDIRGTIPGFLFLPNNTYEVRFIVLIRGTASGWESPVTIELKRSNEIIHTRQESLLNRPRDEWVGITVGSFLPRVGETPGMIEFSLFEHGSHWKRGLIVKSVIIYPIVP